MLQPGFQNTNDRQPRRRATRACASAASAWAAVAEAPVEESRTRSARAAWRRPSRYGSSRSSDAIAGRAHPGRAGALDEARCCHPLGAAGRRPQDRRVLSCPSRPKGTTSGRHLTLPGGGAARLLRAVVKRTTSTRRPRRRRSPAYEPHAGLIGHGAERHLRRHRAAARRATLRRLSRAAAAPPAKMRPRRLCAAALAVPFLIGIAVLRGLTVEIDTFHGTDAAIYQLPTITQFREGLTSRTTPRPRRRCSTWSWPAGASWSASSSGSCGC